MAKGNVLLGTVRGSIGDITMTRQNGMQIARARNRHPRKSNVNKLRYQRAIVGTVARAYAAGKEIFDHAFEGVPVGADSQSRFMSLNTRALRSELSAFTGGEDLSPVPIVTAPGISMPVPGRYIVSTGSLSQKLFTITPPMEGEVSGAINLRNITRSGVTFAEYFAENDLKEGDYITFVFFFSNPKDIVYQFDEEWPESGVAASGFGYARCIVGYNAGYVPTDVIEGEDLASFLTVDKLYYCNGLTFDELVFSNNGEKYLSANVYDFISPINPNENEITSLAVIHSRPSTSQRSYSEMSMTYNGSMGITPEFLLSVWSRPTVPLGSSDLLLESNGKAAKAVLTPSLPVEVLKGGPVTFLLDWSRDLPKPFVQTIQIQDNAFEFHVLVSSSPGYIYVYRDGNAHSDIARSHYGTFNHLYELIKLELEKIYKGYVFQHSTNVTKTNDDINKVRFVVKNLKPGEVPPQFCLVSPGVPGSTSVGLFTDIGGVDSEGRMTLLRDDGRKIPIAASTEAPVFFSSSGEAFRGAGLPAFFVAIALEDDYAYWSANALAILKYYFGVVPYVSANTVAATIPFYLTNGAKVPNIIRLVCRDSMLQFEDANGDYFPAAWADDFAVIGCDYSKTDIYVTDVSVWCNLNDGEGRPVNNAWLAHTFGIPLSSMCWT